MIDLKCEDCGTVHGLTNITLRRSYAVSPRTVQTALESLIICDHCVSRIANREREYHQQMGRMYKPDGSKRSLRLANLHDR